ncbi:MAG TPA: 3-dehydroquinate synthase, partial [Dialister sp.]|nr:3-dehydroquinate synthase [Dialister sp.]
AVLKKLALPTAIGVPAEELIPHALHDKKRRGKEITLVVMRSIGRAELVKVPTEALADWIVTE